MRPKNNESVATARMKNKNEEKDKQKYEYNWYMNKLSLMVLCASLKPKFW